MACGALWNITALKTIAVLAASTGAVEAVAAALRASANKDSASLFESGLATLRNIAVAGPAEAERVRRTGAEQIAADGVARLGATAPGVVANAESLCTALAPDTLASYTAIAATVAAAAVCAAYNKFW